MAQPLAKAPPQAAPLRVGVDIGGTYTDLIAQGGEGGLVRLAKTPTTPEDPAEGVMNALAEAGLDLGAVDVIVHGTTITTNAFIERRIAKVGLITTEGFRDILELGRRTRPQPYGMTGEFEPLIPREMRLEVSERIDAEGQVLQPVDPEDVKAKARQLVDAGCEALVIHFLHAYANPSHELAALAAAREVWPNAFVTAGHQLLSEFREYERGCTASINAAVQPTLARYLESLQWRLRAGGYRHDLLVMLGNGGATSAEIAWEEALKSVMSGPASGVIAASWIARQSGLDQVITYDMGGTSSDVGLILEGEPSISSEREIDYAMPVHVPMVDVHTIGAGGGSIAFLDEAGLLQVGPQSAGALPGPICYGRGGQAVTVTDANFLLGRLSQSRLTGIGQPATAAKVEAAMARDIGADLGLGPMEAAEAVLRIANQKMAGAIRLVSLERGHDPRDFTLFAFGGAGPLHATALARELAVPRVLVPPRPGVANALGCLVADARRDFVKTLNVPLSRLDEMELRETFVAQVAAGEASLAEEKTDFAAIEAQHSADMQFRGQTHLLRVALPSANVSKDELARLFEAAFHARFAVSLPEIEAVVVNLNTTLVGRHADHLAGQSEGAGDGSLEETLVERRPVWFNGAMQDTPVYDRQRLTPGLAFAGPAIVEQLDATTVVEPDDRAEIDSHGNLIITIGEGRA